MIVRRAILVPTLLVAGFACGSGDAASGRRFLSIGTAGTGGIYYPLGGAIASRLSTVDMERRYTAEVTGGSVENLNRIAKGEMDLGFSISTSVYEAYHGGDSFRRPLTRLRVVAPLYPNVTHILVARGVRVSSLAELRGRPVSVGAPGSGTEQVARQLLEAYGLGRGDVEARYLSFRESADALRDGAIDAAILSVGYPASAVLEATTSGGAQLLAVDTGHRDALARRYPYYAEAMIPRGAYPGVTADLWTVSVMNWVVGREDLDESVVRHLLEILRDQRDRLVQVHDIARQIDLRALDRSPIPLHPAAQRWWESEKRSAGS